MGSVKKIVELQNIDSQLLELEEILGDLPRKVEESIAEEQKTLSNIEENKNRIKEIQLELNKMELRVKEDNEKINNLKDQLFQVTTNRQYDAIMSEIDHLKEQLDSDETVEIKLFSFTPSSSSNFKRFLLASSVIILCSIRSSVQYFDSQSEPLAL